MTMKKIQILLVEDDASFGMVLKSYLELHNYSITLASDGHKALTYIRNNQWDLCVFDVMLPGVDGFSVAKELRRVNPDVPFVFLTAKALKEDVLKGFRLGADDYITKPFDSEVLLCKINAILNRKGAGGIDNNEKVEIGEFTFDPELRTLEHKEEKVSLTQRESELLQMLVNHQDTVLKREDALRKIWGDDSYFNVRNMDVYLTRLRKYLRKDPLVRIVNIHGSGFRLSIGVEDA
ncbi:MAG: response regulator transcription factor [Bacteroidetes bacterium]|nr:response regulator transcription factor [Bacteroidota bacterium]MBU1718052.1 response regulator transcription factor [Bacteroidota bacterium]